MLAKPLQVGRKEFSGNAIVPSGKSLILCKIWSRPYIVTEVVRELITILLSTYIQRTRTQVVNRKSLPEILPRDNELPNLLFNYDKSSNNEKTERFFIEYAKGYLFQQN